MDEMIAAGIWTGAGAYAVAGVCVAAFLLLGGVRVFDRTAAESPLQFKLMALPGMIALWPLMLARLAGAKPAEDKR